MKRQTVLLLPGMLNTGAIFSKVAPVLADVADIRIVDGFREPSIDAMADSAARLAGADAVRLVGFSMGGYVALDMMARGLADIAGLALVDSAVRNDEPADLAMREKAISAARRDFPAYCERTIDFCMHPAARSDAEMRALMRDNMTAIGLEGCIAQMRAVTARGDYRAAAQTFAGPTAVICGRQDQVTPLAWSEDAAALIPGAALSVIEDCGHMSVIERPAPVAAALRAWLACDAPASNGAMATA